MHLYKVEAGCGMGAMSRLAVLRLLGRDREFWKIASKVWRVPRPRIAAVERKVMALIRAAGVGRRK